jgi:hypothetical protein
MIINICNLSAQVENTTGFLLELYILARSLGPVFYRLTLSAVLIDIKAFDLIE